MTAENGQVRCGLKILTRMSLYLGSKRLAASSESYISPNPVDLPPPNYKGAGLSG